MEPYVQYRGMCLSSNNKDEEGLYALIRIRTEPLDAHGTVEKWDGVELIKFEDRPEIYMREDMKDEHEFAFLVPPVGIMRVYDCGATVELNSISGEIPLDTSDEEFQEALAREGVS